MKVSHVIIVGLLCSTMPVFASDWDEDGVPDSIDVCNSTPVGTVVDSQGRPLGDLDRDCDTDLQDYALFQQGFTGPLTGTTMNLAPGGWFEMGDHHDTGWPDSLPTHSVYLSPFFIDQFETTNQEYCHFLNARMAEGLLEVTNSIVYQSSNSKPYCGISSQSNPCYITWNDSTFSPTPGKEDHPATNVTWFGAAAYANWRSEMDGRDSCYDLENWTCDISANGYRLPTEAEWEFAARGGQSNPYWMYPWGDEITGADANFWDSGDPYEQAGYPETTPVGYYDGNQIPEGPDRDNGLGLYDMAGNVWEWCNDWYEWNYYSAGDERNPTGPENGTLRVLRGGSWGDYEYLQCATRERDLPGYRSYLYGFRLVRKAPCMNDLDCDDGLYCNGAETCGEGVCQDGEAPCLPEECNEETDTCLVSCDDNEDCQANEFCNDEFFCQENECTTNADCDDGQFCNGQETCYEHQCAAGVPPCENCDEATDTCPGALYVLTVGSDDFTGTAGDDYFDARQDYTTPATPVDTLNATDWLDGGDGYDMLYAELTNDVNPAKLAGIEHLKYTMKWSKTLTATQAAQLQEITNFASSSSSIVTGLVIAPETLNIVGCANNTTVTIISNTMYPTLTGSDDSLNLDLDGATAGTVTVQPSAAGSGYETINLYSEGSIPNNITLDDGNGNSLSNLYIAGSADCTLSIMPNTITTFDGSNASGDLAFDVDTVASTVKGGSGDDVFKFYGNYTAGTTEVDGGPGIDELQANSAQVVGKTAPVAGVTRIETIGIANALGGSLDITYFGATNTTLRAGSGAQTITMPADGTLTFAGATDTTGNVTVAAKYDTGADFINVIFDSSAGPMHGDSLLATTFETMNLDVRRNSAAYAINLSTYPGVTQAITVTGAAATTVSSTNADVVNASTTTGVQTWTLAGAGTLIGGSANDVLTGSAGQDSLTGNAGNDTLSGMAENDVLNAGAGNDTLSPGAGSDIMTGGSGNDTFVIDGLAAYGSDTNIITDFDAASSTTSADVFKWDVSALEGLTGVTDLVDTSANSSAGSYGDHVFKLQTSDGQTIVNADIVGIIGTYTSAASAIANKTNWTITFGATMADNDAFLVAYSVGSNVHIAVAVSHGTSVNSDGIDYLIDICKLENVDLDNLDTSDFNSQA